MAYEKSVIYTWIREDLEKYNGRRQTVKAGLMERMTVTRVSPGALHVNPDDEFTDPQIGPNDAIVENYCRIARRAASLHERVYEEPIIVRKLRAGGYLILNGHHRWAGAMKARIGKVHISIVNS